MFLYGSSLGVLLSVDFVRKLLLRKILSISWVFNKIIFGHFCQIHY